MADVLSRARAARASRTGRDCFEGDEEEVAAASASGGEEGTGDSGEVALEVEVEVEVDAVRRVDDDVEEDEEGSGASGASRRDVDSGDCFRWAAGGGVGRAEEVVDAAAGESRESGGRRRGW